MLPNHVLSSSPVAAPFLAPRDRKKEPLEDWEQGGVAIQNSSQGLRVYDWRGRVIGNDVILDVPGIVAPTTVLTLSGITEMQFTFDQNMNPVIAYMRSAECAFRWFNPTINAFETITLEDRSFAPRCALDDKRRNLLDQSDVLVTYMRDGSLYFREQRDRFLIEYELETGFEDSETLGQFGMNSKRRMQWQIVRVVPTPEPVITLLDPASVEARSGAFTLSITGTGFVTSSLVTFYGELRAVTYVSPTELEVAILSGDVDDGRSLDVVVVNTPPGGGASTAASFDVEFPVPSISSLSPTEVDEESGAFTLTVNGTGFFPETVVRFDSNDRTTTYVSPTQVTAAILAADVETPGSYDVTAFNPTPGGGESTAESFDVIDVNPLPTLISLDPSTVVEDDGSFTLEVTGTGFVASTVVNWDGSPRTTTFINSTTLEAAILSTDVDDVGTFSVTATSPGPGGGTSNALDFEVTSVPADPYFANVVSLMHFDGANNSTTFTDVIAGRTWTRAGSGTVISTAQSVFGGSSLSTPGTSNYLYSDTSADFGFGTGDFTIEGWHRTPSSLASFYFINDYRTGDPQDVPTLFYNSAWVYYAAGSVRISGGSASTNTWYHIAVSRVSGTTRLFVDGALIGSFSDSINYASARQLFNANGNGGGFGFGGDQFNDEWRVTKGVGRYTSAFTPAGPFPDF